MQGGNALIKSNKDVFLVDAKHAVSFYKTKTGIGITIQNDFINDHDCNLNVLSIERFLQLAETEYSNDVKFWQLITEAAKLRIQ